MLYTLTPATQQGNWIHFYPSATAAQASGPGQPVLPVAVRLDAAGHSLVPLWTDFERVRSSMDDPRRTPRRQLDHRPGADPRSTVRDFWTSVPVRSISAGPRQQGRCATRGAICLRERRSSPMRAGRRGRASGVSHTGTAPGCLGLHHAGGPRWRRGLGTGPKIREPVESDPARPHAPGPRWGGGGPPGPSGLAQPAHRGLLGRAERRPRSDPAPSGYPSVPAQAISRRSLACGPPSAL